MADNSSRWRAPWPLIGCLLAALALLSASPAAGAAEDAGIDVCPANSPAKALPFLRLAKPGGLRVLVESTLAGNEMAIDMTAVTEFVKKTLVPLIGANVFFFVITALFLLIFILWRLLRWCCYILCCRGSCDEKRSQRDPYDLLFGRGTKVLKGFMALFGLTAIAFAVYGMATVDKDVTSKAWVVLDTITAYATRVTGSLDALLDTVASVETIIDDFQAVIVQIDIPGFTTHLTAVGAFLDGIPQPSALSTSIGALSTLAATSLPAALTALSTGLPGLTTDLGSMAGWLTTLAGAPAQISVISADVTDLNTRLAAPALVAFNPASGTPPAAGNAAITNLKTSVDAAITHITGTNWVTALTAVSTALDNAVGTNNPFAKLLARVAAVQSLVGQFNTAVPALASDIANITTQYTTVGNTSITWLLDQLVVVNNTVLQLDSGMQAAYDELLASDDQLATFFNATPSPAALMTSLSAAQSALPALTPLATLTTDLNTAQSALFAAYSVSNTAAYKAWLTSTLATLNSLLTATVATGPLGTLQTTLAAFQGSTATWAQLCTAANAAAPLLTTLGGATQMGATAVTAPATGIAAVYATAAGGGYTPPVIAVASAQSYVTAASNSLSSSMPNLGPIKASVDAVAASFAALGSPSSTVVAGPRAQLEAINATAVATGNSVKEQIGTQVATFRNATDRVKSMAVGRLEDAQSQYEAPVKQYDGYRYIAGMVLYAVSILFVALLLLASLANYHFGANISTLGLLLVTLLYFLLALLIALLVSVLHLGCGDLEPLMVELAPATFTPLLRYYFYGEGTNVSAVLKDADLVDLDALTAQITSSQASVMDSLTSSYTFRSGPLAVIGRVNTTMANVTSQFAGLLGLANREELLPVYEDVKGFVCCAVPDTFASMWIGLTFAGVFAFALIFCTFWYIGKIDRAPRTDCCGCTCHTAAKYAGTVQPYPHGGDRLPQYNTTAGFDGNAFGAPYDAPLAPISGLGGSEGFAQVVVQAPGGGGVAKKLDGGY